MFLSKFIKRIYYRVPSATLVALVWNQAKAIAGWNTVPIYKLICFHGLRLYGTLQLTNCTGCLCQFQILFITTAHLIAGWIVWNLSINPTVNFHFADPQHIQSRTFYLVLFLFSLRKIIWLFTPWRIVTITYVCLLHLRY